MPTSPEEAVAFTLIGAVSDEIAEGGCWITDATGERSGAFVSSINPVVRHARLLGRARFALSTSDGRAFTVTVEDVTP